MRSRVKLGIKNLDKMIDGGIPEGNQVAIAGGPGTGKTLLGFEYLYHNAKEGNNGILFSLEETSNMVIENAKAAFTDFTDIDDLIASKKLVVYGSEEGTAYVTRDPDKGTYSFGEWISNLESVASQYHATRIVIDSISVVRLLIRDQFEYRDTTMNLVRVLKRLNATTLITVELETAEKEKLTFQPEFFMYDGIIALYLSGEGSNRIQTLEIIKMRGTAHSFSTIPYEITSSGISVLELPHGEDINDV
ncbi:MAG: ATPase domain-containing protein [Candidatus Micrarchaeia archaeon]